MFAKFKSAVSFILGVTLVFAIIAPDLAADVVLGVVDAVTFIGERLGSFSDQL